MSDSMYFLTAESEIISFAFDPLNYYFTIVKRMSKVNQKDIEELYTVILKLETLSECKKFFRDLLTAKEINDITERWKIAKMLANGVPYSQIESELGISSTTIARVHKWLKGGKGGYLMMMQRLGIV